MWDLVSLRYRKYWNLVVFLENVVKVLNPQIDEIQFVMTLICILIFWESKFMYFVSISSFLCYNIQKV